MCIEKFGLLAYLAPFFWRSSSFQLSDTSTKQASTTPVSLLTEVLLDVVALLDDRQDNCQYVPIPVSLLSWSL